ncbi:MAG: hypothetical protein PHR35_03605 [Kiritimatiellae bacterium]|nr:hypothetical protein [Kiritimatiellia bacterium]
MRSQTIRSANGLELVMGGWRAKAALLALVGCARGMAAHAAILTQDGNFGNQSEGATLVAPWNGPVSLAQGSTNSQSPFTNVFAENGKGAYWATNMNAYFCQTFTPAIESDATGRLYMNVDFMIPSDKAGGFSIFLTDSSFVNFSVWVQARSDGFYARSASGDGTAICSLERGVWYNTQLTIDLDANTYSGAVINARTSERVLISSRSMGATDKKINLLGANIVNALGNFGCRIDNWVLSDSELPAPPYIEPIDPGYLTTDGDFGLQPDGAPLVSPWNAPSSLAQGSSASQSPFVNVFVDNDKGAYWATNMNAYFCQTFAPAIASNATGLLYMNVDFMIPSTRAGGFNIFLCDASFVNFTAQLMARSDGFFALSASGNGTSICPLQAGSWYNVQLTLDLDANTYGGGITKYDTLKRVTIPSRSLMVSDKKFELLGANIVNALGNAGCRIDNWVLGTKPFSSPVPFGTVIILK